MKKLTFLLVAALMLAACGGNSKSDSSGNAEQTSENQTEAENVNPFLGDILAKYEEETTGDEPKGYRQIQSDMEEVMSKAKGRTIEVTGSPYGIKTHKAEIIDCNVQKSCINIIVRLIPDEGANFDDFKANYGGLVQTNLDKLIECKATTSNGETINSSTVFLNNKTNDLCYTMIIKDPPLWKNIDHIELTEYKRK